MKMKLAAASTQPNHWMKLFLVTITTTRAATATTSSATASSCHTRKSTWLLHWARVCSRVRMT